MINMYDVMLYWLFEQDWCCATRGSPGATELALPRCKDFRFLNTAHITVGGIPLGVGGINKEPVSHTLLYKLYKVIFIYYENFIRIKVKILLHPAGTL